MRTLRTVAGCAVIFLLMPIAGFAQEWRDCANTQREAKNYAQALTCAERGVRAADSAQGFYERGRVYQAMGKYDEALADYAEVSRRAPQSELPLIQSGRVRLFGKHDPVRALEDLTTASRLAPSNPEAHYWQGMAYYSLGQIPQAVSVISEAIKLEPGAKLYYLRRAHLFVLLGDAAQAMRDWETMITLDPTQSVRSRYSSPSGSTRAPSSCGGKSGGNGPNIPLPAPVSRDSPGVRRRSRGSAQRM